MKINRKIIEIDEELCDGCGQCVPSCAEGALQIIDGKAKLVAEVYCDGLGACLGDCPTGALKIVEREAEDFDEKAVEERLETLEKETLEELKTQCPSSVSQSFSPGISCKKANEPTDQKSSSSTLSHWPVQIRLIPPDAPFLKGADILVAADCTAIAYANLHQDYIAGKVVMMGCPKFDNAEAYVEKFADIFKKADIKSITALVMEVPCCQGMPVIIEKAMEKAGKSIPLNKVVISRTGEVIQQ